MSETARDDTTHEAESAIDSTAGSAERASESVSQDAALSTAQLRKDLSIDDNQLDGEMTQQAGLYGYYAAQYAKAQYQADIAKSRAEVVRAQCYKRHRNRLVARGRKFTENALEAEVLTDESYIEAQTIANKHRMKATLAKEALTALTHKRDMLIQKGVARREEMKGELYVKEKEDPRAKAKRLMDERKRS